MILDIFRSLSGDCILITTADGKRILADGGMPDAYSDFVAESLAKLRDAGHGIDVAYVSHIDRDHIGGILRLLDYEVLWRAWDFKQTKGVKSKKPKVPRPPPIGEIWHNAFLETIAKSNAVKLGASGLANALGDAAAVLVALNAARAATPQEREAAERTRMLATSVGDALEVNWRISPDQLGIPLNPAYAGNFMVAGKSPLQVGNVAVTVVAPTTKELKALLKEWNDWLKEKRDYVEDLRRSHASDEAKLRSAVSPQSRALAARSIALAAKKDVTPPNVASLVLLLQEGQTRVLMTGDADEVDIVAYLGEAGLGSPASPLEVDVLKVPHHGAHNSYSADFLRTVHACHYVFCGDGEHHNPEYDVVAGYVAHCLERSAPHKGKRFHIWFNCSSTLCADAWLDHWRSLEAQFEPATVRAVIEPHFLTAGVSHRLTL